MKTITLNPSALKKLHETSPRLISYNIEMTEVTGGTFWKCYTPEQVSGKEEFPKLDPNVQGNFLNLTELMQEYPPIDLYNEKIRAFAKELGPAWVRVSGTWATTTYYDFDGHTNGKVPEGFRSVLTKEQWIGVLDFVKDTDARLLISVGNCEGNHNPDGSWNPEQAKLIFDFSKEYGVPINAAEFTNEPNAMEVSGTPKGYTAEDFARDQDAFFRFINDNYPEILTVGPCGAGDSWCGEYSKNMRHPVDLDVVPTEEILKLCKEKPDVFSYHYYNGLSERGAFMGGHWDASEAHTDEYIGESERACRITREFRDKYTPGAPMWVTESGDAGAGGNTWASTYLDVLRFANELGVFSSLTHGIIFHNTFCSSDYGLLAPETYEIRPNYWLCWLWNRLMGTTVYDAGGNVAESLHIYAHSRRDGKKGAAYLIVNNSLTGKVTVELPGIAECYTMSAEFLRSGEVMINGQVMPVNGTELPYVSPVTISTGAAELPPATVTFVIV